MVQQVIVIAVVAGCLAWVGWQVYRYFVPVKGAGCGGGCGCGKEKAGMQEGGGEVGAAKGEMMISSDSLRARVAARK